MAVNAYVSPGRTVRRIEVGWCCVLGVVHGQNVMSCRNRFIIALSRPNIGNLLPSMQSCRYVLLPNVGDLCTTSRPVCGLLARAG